MAASEDEAAAWSTFWAEQETELRCLAKAPPALLHKLDNHWRAFAVGLPPSASILDIGCGGGIVGRLLVEGQSALQVTGVDFAVVPTSVDPRIKLLSLTPMENLPFADASFDGAVSQFGYEYGKNKDAACELARVLRTDAPFSFVIHHAESPFVSGMRSHQSAIASVCGPELRNAFLSGAPEALDRQLTDLSAAFPEETIIGITATALRTHVHQAEDFRSKLWKLVVDALAPEAVMLSALEEHCVAPQQMGAWLRPLSSDFDLGEPAILSLGTGEPVAWLVHGVRREN